jgi:hypothetical protein
MVQQRGRMKPVSRRRVFRLFPRCVESAKEAAEARRVERDWKIDRLFTFLKGVADLGDPSAVERGIAFRVENLERLAPETFAVYVDRHPNTYGTPLAAYAVREAVKIVLARRGKASASA